MVVAPYNVGTHHRSTVPNHERYDCQAALLPRPCRLVADYEKWAASPEYRRRRTQQGSDADTSSVQ
jgi:hypothetical protein